MCMEQEASMDLMICIIVIQWGAFGQESSTLGLGVCVHTCACACAFDSQLCSVYPFPEVMAICAVIYHKVLIIILIFNE